MPDQDPRQDSEETPKKPFLPTTWAGWVVVGFVGLIALVSVVVALLFLSARLTGGSLGLEISRGNSLSERIPEGSTVLTLPLRQEPYTYVTAMTQLPDDARDTTDADRQRKLSVKWYNGSRLISTDSSECYSRYEYRGRVVAVLPTHKWFPWLDTGAQKTGYQLTAEQRAEAVDALDRRESAHRQVLAAKGLTEYTPAISAAPGSKLGKSNWGDPRVVSEKPVSISKTFVEFTIVKVSWIELTLGPVPPTTATRNGKPAPAQIETGWLQPGKYRFTWTYKKGACSDTPSCSYRFYRKK
jgi:hypothetical protein